MAKHAQCFTRAKPYLLFLVLSDVSRTRPSLDKPSTDKCAEDDGHSLVPHEVNEMLLSAST
jgi:hypothetical protein